MARYISVAGCKALGATCIATRDSRTGELVAIWDIDNIPFADVRENVRGEWKEKTVNDEVIIEEWQSACCSVCGKYHTTPYMYYFDDFNFCPNCGADMRSKDA